MPLAIHNKNCMFTHWINTYGKWKEVEIQSLAATV